MFSGEQRLVHIILDISILGAFIDRFGRDIRLCENDNGTLTAQVEVAVSPAFYSWLFQFGGKAQLVYPENLIDEYRKMLKNAEASL